MIRPLQISLRRLGLILLLMPVVIALAQEKSTKEDCQALYQDIQNDFELGRLCAKDSDCQAVAIPLDYQSSFGCAEYTNKNANLEAIFKKIAQYHQKCDPTDKMSLINCSAPSEPACVNNKCAEKKP